MIDILICGGFSPSARVLRAAVREISKERDVRITTITPVLAGHRKEIEFLNGIPHDQLIVIDGCDGSCASCALHTLNEVDTKPCMAMMIDKFGAVTSKAVAKAKSKIIDELSRMSSQ